MEVNMGIKEKMMDSMMNGMSPEEKKEMMAKMMEKFFEGMAEEEKEALMKDMMPKTMQHMMGESGSMRDMMRHMMGHELGHNGEGEGANPMDMCKEFIQSIKQSKEISAIVTPEINAMFEEWVSQVNEEILNHLKEKKSLSIKSIAEHLKISEESAIYFAAKLGQSKRIDIDIKINEN
jgi:hypothetical protein